MKPERIAQAQREGAKAPSLNTNLLGILLLYLLLAISLLGACSGVASSAGKSLGNLDDA